MKETVSLSTLLGDKLHVMDVVIYEKHLRVAFPLGLEAPCYATAAGIKLMSILKDDVIDSYIPAHCTGLSKSISKDLMIKEIIESRDHIVYKEVASVVYRRLEE